MKKIERIREDYDIITEKDDSDTRKLTSLVRAGLFDQNKLPMLKRALQKDPSKLTMAERKGLLELLDSLMSQVLHSQSVYSKVKQNVGTDMNEAVKDHYGVDPRFGNSAAVSERDMPTIIILKRKSIRVYPDNQKVGLYYSQYLDRYVAIPFGMSKKNAPFTAINEELDEAVNWHAAAQDYFKDNPEDSDKKTKEKLNIHPSQFEDDEDRAKHIEKLKKFVTQKAAQGKIRSIHYSGVTSKYLGGDAEKRSLKKTANKEFNKSSSFMDYAAGHTGVAVGNAVRKVAHGLRDKIRAIRNKPVGDAKYANAPKIPKIEEPKKEVPAPAQEPKKSGFNMKLKDVKPPKVQEPSQAPKTPVTSTSGKATASFGGSMSSPITARVLAPAQQTSTTPKVKQTPSKPESNKENLRPIQQALKKKWRPSKRREEVNIKESFRRKVAEKRKIEEVSLGDVADTAADIAVPFYSAAKNLKQGNYGKAAVDAAIDVGAGLATPFTAGASWAARMGAKSAIKAGEKIAAHGAETAAAKGIERGAVKAGEKAGEQAVVKDTEKAVAKPASVASKVGGTLAKGAGKTLKLGGKILKGAALIGAGLAAGAGSSSANDDKKELSPAKFGMNVKTNKPEAAGTKTGVDTRTSNLYRKSFEGSMKEETAKDDEDKTKTSTPRRFLKPAAASNSKVKISAPKPAGVTTGVDARMRKYERDFYGQQNESVMSQIMTMVNEDVTEMQLNIGENTLKINNTIAKKVVGVYESLNTENKKKMEDMLNEGTTESFMKLINFAVRQ